MWRGLAGPTLAEMGRATTACSLALLAGFGSGIALRPASAPAVARASTCSARCAAAYSAIARALPADRTAGLADAVLATPGFDYGRLSRALGVPTNAQLRAKWRRRCDALFPDDRPGANDCYRLILPSTYRYLDAIPA